MRNCGAIILAAGGSSRLGEPKQLLMFQGEALLARTVRIAMEAGADPVVVVLGAHAEECAAAITGQHVRVVGNPEWREGIASSIRAGVAALGEDTEAAVILLCDQPGISTDLVHRLMASPKEIAACDYGETTGPPVYFVKTFFNELLELRGDKGAKSLLSRHTGSIDSVPFPEGTWDVDFPGDLSRLVG